MTTETITVNSETVITVLAGVDIVELPAQTIEILEIAQQGPQGIPGDGADMSYRHVQSSPLSQWVINHNLGRIPSITLLTVGLVEFFADITHTNTNQAIVTMASANAGIAECN